MKKVILTIAFTPTFVTTGFSYNPGLHQVGGTPTSSFPAPEMELA